MQTPQTLNITVGTDVILNVYLEHEGDAITPSLIDDLQANLITGLGKKTPMEANITADYVVVNIPWVDGRLPGCYSLELTGSINNLAWSAVGKSIIRYTSATETGRSTVVVTGDSYDVTMEVGYYYTDSPIEQVQVTVDDQVGEPYVVSSYVKKKLQMDFHNMKGETGKTGGVGPRGIHGESAVFDPNTGNIAVIEQATGGSITNPMSQMAVTEALVADWGVYTVKAYSQQYFIGGGTPNKWQNGSDNNTCRIYEVTPGHVFRFTRNNELGYHVVFLTTDEINVGQIPSYYDGSTDNVAWIQEDTIILVPDGAAYMYIREMRDGVDRFPSKIEEGVFVKDMVLNQEPTAEEEWDSNAVDLSVYTASEYYINSDGMWGLDENGNNLSKMITVKPGMRYLVISADDVSHNAIFLKDDTMARNQKPHYVDGEDYIHEWVKGAEELTAPNDAGFMYLRTKRSGSYIEQEVRIIETLGDKMDVVEMEGTAAMNAFRYNDLLLKFVNNSGLWAVSSNYVNSCKILPVIPGATYKLVVREGVPSFHAFFLKDDFSDSGFAPHYVDGIDTLPARSAFTQYLTAPSDARFLYIRCYQSGLNREPYVTEYVSGDELHDGIAEERNLVRQAAKTNDKLTPTLPSFRLLHYSDLHGDEGATASMLDYLRLYQGVINDSIVTGDVVHFNYASSDQYPNGAAWWQGCGLADKSLFVLGNHDGRASGATDGKGQAADYDTYIAPYAEDLGIILPEGHDDPDSPYYKACYWHKDYPAEKIRLIGIDAIHRFDGILNPSTGELITPGLLYNFTTQEEWLIARLNETLAGSGNTAAGFSVIVCGHYPLDDFDDSNRENMVWNDSTHKWVCNRQSYGGIVMNGKTASQTNWHYGVTKMVQDAEYNMRNRVGTPGNWDMGNVNNIGDILNVFIGRGGKLVAWLCGHWHCDFMYYPQSYPNILNIAINQTGFLRGGTEADKNAGAPIASANLLAVDTNSGLLKIVRLGQNVNRLMAPMHTICYDYINKKVINEW